MNKMQKIVTSVLSLILCLFFIVSIVDTNETVKKTNFDQEQMLTHIEKLSENFNTLVDAVVKAKPAAAKGQYLKSIVVSSTMGVGIKVNTAKYGV